MIAFILFEIPFQFDVYLDYQDVVATRGGIGGWNISVTTFCLLLLYAQWLVQLGVRQPMVQRAKIRAVVPGLSYVAIVGMSALYAGQTSLALFELFTMSQAFLLLVFMVAKVRAEEDVVFVVTVLLLGLAFESVIMIGSYMVGHSLSFASIEARVDESGRVGGSIGSPNEAASYLTLLVPLALGVCCGQRAGLRRLAFVVFALGTVAMVTTGSRGGWIGCSLAIIIFSCLALRAGRLHPWVPAIVLGSGAVIAACFHGTIYQRLADDDRGAARSRIPLMQLAMEMIADRPVLGVGANNMAVAMKPYEALPRYREQWLYVVHNRYLQVFVETGIVGLAAFLCFLGCGLRRAWACWKLEDRDLSPIALGLLSGIVGEMAHITVETFSGRPQIQILWTTMGLIIAMHFIKIATPDQRSAEPPDALPLTASLLQA